MAAPMKRVVGWFDRSEWECVYHELYSDHFIKQQHALDRIAVWKCRIQHRLSMAIDVTSQLLSAKLQACQAKQQGTLPHMEQQLGMALALAVIRFVNLLTEKGQNRQYAQPIHVLANELGLPEWMVDLRHNATHAAQPGIPVLLTAVEFALSWLKEEYWEAQLDDSDAEPDPSSEFTAAPDTSIKREAADLLYQYMQLQYPVCSANGASEGCNPDEQAMRDILMKMERICLTNRVSVMEVLLDDGYMCPTEEQLAAFGLSVDDLISSEDLDIPENLVTLWQPLLKSFHRLGYTPQLLETAGLNITEENTLKNRLLMGWIAGITTAIKKRDNGNGRDPAMTIFYKIYKQGCDLNLRSILDSCLKHPNRWLASLLPRLFIIVRPPLSSKQQSMLLHLCGMYTKCSMNESCNPEDLPHVHTLQSIITGKDSVDTFDEMEVDDEDCSNLNDTPNRHTTPCRWVLDTRVADWSKYPLGKCPGQVVTYTSLELPPQLSFSHRVTDSTSGHVNDSSRLTGKSHSESIVRSDFDAWSREELRDVTRSIKIF